MKRTLSLSGIPLLLLLIGLFATFAYAYPDMAGREHPFNTQLKPENPGAPTDDYPQMPGWPKQMGLGIYSPCEGPIMVDIDGNGDLEIFAGSSDCYLYGWHHDGTNVTGFPYLTNNPIQSSPAAGDIDGDGDLEVLVLNRSTFSGTPSGDVYALHHNGTPVTGWPQHTSRGVGINSVSLYDLDGDGVYEVFAATDQLYAWQGNGTLMTGFPVAFSGSQYGGCSTSAAGDIDGDGAPEIVVEGWDYLNAFNNDGSIVSGFPYALPGGQGFSYSAPSLVDVDNDGSVEIFCGSHGSPDSWLYGLRGNGTSLPGFPQSIEGWTYSTPAIGDLDGDGQVEIALLCNSGLLYAFETNGSPMAGWPVNMGHYNCEGALAMADIDNNNQMDVLFGNNGGAAYQYLCYRANGTPHPDFPFTTSGASLPSCSAIADADNDGDLEIAFHTSNGAVNLWTAPYAAAGAMLPWPQPHHDIQHTGNYHHGAVTHDLTVDLTPLNPPITIPAGGGSFSYTITIVNHENNPVSAQFWTMLRLPNGTNYGPVVGPVTRTVGALDTLMMTRSLYIPGRAPTGNYTYTGYIGQYPGSAWNDDSFPFIKAGDQVMGNEEWAINDEEMDGNSSQLQNFALCRVSPNPFNPSTVISYNLQNSANVNLSVYDITGRLVQELVNSRQDAGDHQITFNGSMLASGIYLYRLTSGSQATVGKLVLLK